MTPDPAPYGAELPRLPISGWDHKALAALDAEVLALREVLREITEDPDGRTGRGCLDLHEARHIARAALLPAPTEEAGRG